MALRTGSSRDGGTRAESRSAPRRCSERAREAKVDRSIERLSPLRTDTLGGVCGKADSRQQSVSTPLRTRLPLLASCRRRSRRMISLRMDMSREPTYSSNSGRGGTRRTWPMRRVRRPVTVARGQTPDPCSTTTPPPRHCPMQNRKGKRSDALRAGPGCWGIDDCSSEPPGLRGTHESAPLRLPTCPSESRHEG